jgi:16S rRNA (uracil1498-N3)-methyltransferase
VNLFYQPEISKGIHYLDEDESRHAVKVLRLKEGDCLDITDGKGTLYKGEITEANGKQCMFKILNQSFTERRGFHIHIAIAPTKNADRIEWFVEKAIELGVDQITFFSSHNSERRNLNHDRITKMAISAMKQSQQVWLPILSPLRSFKEVIAEQASQKFIAYVDHDNQDQLKSLAKQGSDYFVLIGPEGDFSNEELDLALKNDFIKVSLGHHRLRTETAGLTACLTLNLIND